MLRLIGILTGSALAVAALIVAVGIPRLSPPGQQLDTTVAVVEVDNAIAAVPPDAAPVQREPAEVPAADALSTAEEPAEEPLSEAAAAALIDEIFAPQPQPEPAALDVDLGSQPAVEDNWYAFWSPFRSEIAASGFVSRLQETTGIDYRIVKVKTGVYEVAFAYSDDDDIQAKLQRISAATGLDMTGS